MGYSPRFKMPEETLGERWHKEAEKENPILAFIAFSGCMLMICLIVVIVGGSQNQAMGYFNKDEIYGTPEDIEHVQPEHSKEEVLEERPIEEEPAFEYDDPVVYYQEESIVSYEPQPVESGYGDWMVAGGETSLMEAGAQYSEDGTRYTWYSENVLPGGGLDIPGRHVGSEGYVMDGEGNICVASSDHEIGTVLDTPYGTAVVYDTGCASDTVDVYTSW